MNVEGVLDQIICSTVILDLINLQMKNVQLTPEVFQQAATLSVKIAENSSITPVRPNLNELKEFIKHELEKLSTDRNIVESIEYSNYTIKPSGITLWYYLILLTDDKLLLKFYTDWLSIKQICILLVEQYKSSIDSGFLHYIVSIHDLFNHFSSPQITEVVQTGGGKANVLILFVALLLLSIGSIFVSVQSGLNPPELRVRSRQVQEYSTANTLYEHLKNVVRNFRSKTVTETEYHVVTSTLNRIGEKFGVSKQEREREGNKVLRVGRVITNGLAAASRQKMVRGSALIIGGILDQFLPGITDILEEDRTNFASTKAINHMYEIGITTGDVYRILVLMSSVFDNQVIAYEKTVEKARKKPSITPNSLGLMTEDIFKLLNSGGLDFIIDSILDTNGIGFLKFPVKGMLHYLPTTTTLASKEEELTMLKYYQQQIATAKELLPVVAQYIEGENFTTQTYQKEDPVDLYYEGGKKKRTKRRMKRKRTRRR